MTADEVAKDIVDAAIKVHRALGPGLLESACQFAWHTNYEEHRVERRHPPNDLRRSRARGNDAWRLDIFQEVQRQGGRCFILRAL